MACRCDQVLRSEPRLSRRFDFERLRLRKCSNRQLRVTFREFAQPLSLYGGAQGRGAVCDVTQVKSQTRARSRPHKAIARANGKLCLWRSARMRCKEKTQRSWPVLHRSTTPSYKGFVNDFDLAGDNLIQRISLSYCCFFVGCFSLIFFIAFVYAINPFNTCNNLILR